MTVWLKMLILDTVMVIIGAVILATLVRQRGHIDPFVIVVFLVLGLVGTAVNTVAIWNLLRPLKPMLQTMKEGTLEMPSVPLVEGRDEVSRMARAMKAMWGRFSLHHRQVSSLALRALEEERARIGLELHDQVGQTLTAALLYTGRLRASCSPEQHADVALVQEAIRTAIDEVRQVASELRPSVLHDMGLEAAVAELCRSAKESSGIEVASRIDFFPPAGSEQDLVIYRVAQESLTNVIRHARATAVTVRLHFREHWFILSVSDNGNGLLGTESTGISGMRERAWHVGGTLSIDAQPGQGTTVTLRVPQTPELHDAPVPLPS